MRKIGSLIIVMVMLLLSISSQAFDISSNGVGGYYNGMMPSFDKHIMGVRYSNNGMKSYELRSYNGSMTEYPVKKQFHTVNYWAAFTIKKKFRVMATLPLFYYTEKYEYGSASMYEPADPALMGFYNVFNNNNRAVDKALPSVSHDVWVGAGLNIPLFSMSYGNPYQHVSRSLDYIVIGTYDLRYQKMGMNVAANYKIGTKDRLDYALGDQMAASAQFYYRYSIAGKGDLLPNIGFHYEHAKPDRDGDYDEAFTGGTALYGTVGLEVSLGSIRIGGVFQPVIFQEVGEGKMELNNRGMLSFAWLLGKQSK